MHIVRTGVVLLLLLLLSGGSAHAAEFSATALAGYKGGLGFKASGTVGNFASGFPLGLELGVGHTRLDPGIAADARKIFINDATDGTPEKSGWMWDFRMDFLYRLRILGLQDAHAYAGVRYSMFTGNFKYIGGNEDFDVTSNQWGWGAGVKASFPMGKSIAFTVAAGFDHYPASKISGHDTSYSPDGETVNGRNNYTFEDANAAINQPVFQPLLMAGITFAL